MLIFFSMPAFCMWASQHWWCLGSHGPWFSLSLVSLVCLVLCWWPAGTVVWANLQVALDPWPLAYCASGIVPGFLDPNPGPAAWAGACWAQYCCPTNLPCLVALACNTMMVAHIGHMWCHGHLGAHLLLWHFPWHHLLRLHFPWLAIWKHSVLGASWL